MHSSSRNGAKVIWLAVHTTEGIMRAVDLRAWTTWPGSSHAANDETGVLLSGAGDGFVDYSRAAWTLRNGNPISDNLEQCGWARWSRAEWLARPKLLDTTARWLAERSKARGIPLVHLSLADIRARKPGVIGHGDYTYATGDGTHTDPGPNYPWDVVIDKARAYANGEDDMPTAADVWSYPVARGGVPGGKVPAIQELADAKSNTIQILAELSGLREVVKTLALDRGDIDVDALLARIDERVDASVKSALAAGVDVDITVGGTSSG